MKLEKYQIDTNGSLRKELDIIENATKELLTKGSQEIIINKKELQNIETKTIEIEGTGNFIGVKNSIINIPLEMIVFPFFTNQKQKRNVNFEYKFTDVGITMRSKLSSFDKNDKVYQPSLLEKKIYNYLIIMYEKNIEEEKDIDYIQFEVADFIEKFLGNKMNSQYYPKVEQALKNLKYTQYEFLVDNHKKAGKLKFESPRFFLLDYTKLKIGKRVYYRVKLNSNIINKIIEKRYIKYDSKNLMEITDRDSVADRIYEYISMKRFNKTEGKEKIEVLAGIIPLQTIKINKVKNKKGKIVEYKTSNMSFVRRRIKKAFNVLKDLGYIKNFKEVEEEPKRYTIYYEFNIAKDNICHISSYLSAPESLALMPSNIEENIYSDEISNYENFEAALKKVKRNIYFAKKYNKRIYKKLVRLCDNEGEEFVVEILNRIYNGLNTEIKKTLGAYIDTIVRNLKKEYSQNVSPKLFNFGNDNTSKNNIEEAEVIEVKTEKEEIIEEEKTDDVQNKTDELENTLINLFENFSEERKEEIVQTAKEYFLKDTGCEKLNPIQEKIFNSENVKKLYIRRVLKEIFGI